MASTGIRPTSCGTSPAGCRRRSEPTPATQSSMAETPCGGLQREDKDNRAEPACRYRGRNERQGHEPVEREPGEHRDHPRDGRPDNDIRGICRISHGGTLNLAPADLVHELKAEGLMSAVSR